MSETWQEVRDRIEGPAWGSPETGPWLTLALALILLCLWRRIVSHLR